MDASLGVASIDTPPGHYRRRPKIICYQRFPGGIE
jgi:hypothetical protein